MKVETTLHCVINTLLQELVSMEYVKFKDDVTLRSACAQAQEALKAIRDVTYDTYPLTIAEDV